MTLQVRDPHPKEHEDDECDKENAGCDRNQLADGLLKLCESEDDRSNEHDCSGSNTSEEGDIPEDWSHSK